MMVAVTETPFAALEDQCPTDGPYVLLKTGRVTPWDRWSILGWDPWLEWRPNEAKNVWNEFTALIEAVTKHEARSTKHDFPIPLLMGAFSYDAGRAIESIPATARTVVHLPDAVLYGFRRLLVMDEREKRGYRVQLDTLPFVRGGKGGVDPEIYLPKPLLTKEGRCHSNFTRATYIAAVEQIRTMIAAGDCYQVNLSQQIHAPCPRSAEDMFRAALVANPAPMMALVNAGDFQLISTSPERLIQKHGDRLVSRPIKGTRPRGATPAQDTALREELLSAAKDNAELAMIVDLLRNDLGRVAVPGSVTVDEPRAIESYANVHHLLATISARLRGCRRFGVASPLVWPDIFLAIFPGGSVTGCPKVQSMRVIEAMEGVRRGFYCGSIGYIAANGDGDWNIAIRTITKIGDRAFFNIGGGVVYDSDPTEEYEETLYKGRTMMQVLRF